MIRVPGIRTGVEIWGDDDGPSLVPPALLPEGDRALLADLQLDDESLAALRWDGSGAPIVNGHLWVHAILDESESEVIGQLVLCSPASATTRAALAGAGMSAPGIEALFHRLRPGDERWSWRPAPGADGFDASRDGWPERFVLKAENWPVPIEDWPGQTFVQTAFPETPVASVSPTAAPRRAYQIETDSEHDTPAGALFVGADGAQEWYAATLYQVDQLIAPGPTGRWRFVPFDGVLVGVSPYSKISLSPT